MRSGTSTATIEAGGTLGFIANAQITHFGPLSFYMARVPDSANINTWEAAGNVWFKVASIDAVRTAGGWTWPAFGICWRDPLLGPWLTGGCREIRGRLCGSQVCAKRQVFGSGREHCSSSGSVPRRGSDLPLLRPGRGHRRRKRKSRTAGCDPGGIQSQRSGALVVLSPRADVVYGARPQGVAGLSLDLSNANMRVAIYFSTSLIMYKITSILLVPLVNLHQRRIALLGLQHRRVNDENDDGLH
jgi:hypothetical protein